MSKSEKLPRVGLVKGLTTHECHSNLLLITANAVEELPLKV